MPLLIPMIESFRDQARLYEVLKSFVVAINENEKAVIAAGGVTGLDSDGNNNEVLTFVQETGSNTEWKGPHEIDTFVSGVF